MNFALAAQGRSFKGAFAYYLHDKRQDSDAAYLSTAERVAWLETRNLATDSPQTARRIMIATAQEAAAKKAGQTGRKDVKPVLAFSLAWHPSEAEGLTRAEMVRAADEALQVAKLDHLQAVLIAHNDTAHPHLHIVLNRIDPHTGKLASTPPQMARDLDKWAYEYEKARGVIVSPERAAKYERTEKAHRERTPNERKAYVDGAKAKAAQQAEALRVTAADAKGQVEPLPRVALADARATTKPPTEGQILKALQDDQKRKHKEQWAQLAEANKSARAAVYDRFGGAFKARAAMHKQEMKPYWRQFFREQEQQEKARREMERTAKGLLAVSLEAARWQMKNGQTPKRGLLAMTFANVISRQRREAVFAAVKEHDRAELVKAMGESRDQKMNTIKAERASALAQQRKAYEARRAALIEAQNAEREKIREAWRQLYVRKGMAPPRAQDLRPMEQRPMKGEFEKRAFGQTPAPKVQQEPRFVSKAAPAPSPMGDAPKPSPRALQDVPKAAPVMPSVSKSVPSPSKAWTKAAEAAPAPSAPSMSKAWGQSVDASLPREIKPLPKRDKDREPDR